jgi:hypothetical protein
VSRALVLGSGGAPGGAWELGALKGAADAGVDPTRADLLVGSSVGAILACLIRSGQSIDDLYTLCTAGAGPFRPTRTSSPLGETTEKALYVSYAPVAVALQLVPETSELAQHCSRHGVEARLVVNGDDRDVPAMPGESDLHHSGSRQRYR